MDIAIVSYQRFSDMPRDVYNQVRLMGHTDVCRWKQGHLRDLANGKRCVLRDACKYRLKSCIVMYVGDTIVGWAALYHYFLDQTENVSLWVKTRHRGNGYGTKLGAEAFRRWYHRRPEVFRNVDKQWKELAAQGK